MAIMTEDDRNEARAEFSTDLSRDREPLAVTVSQLKAAVDALDDYMHANAGAINAAIPQPARAALTVSQKARLLNYVVRKRYIRGA